AEFLHRMLTCDLQRLAGDTTRRGFQLNDKGRIVADLMVHHGDADTWLETDVLDLPALQELLEQRLFAEDVALEDFSAQRTKLVLHGPAALALLRAVADEPARADRVAETAGTHHVVPVNGAPVSVYRRDDAGALGLHLLVPTDTADAQYQTLLDAAGFEPGDDAEPDAEAAQRRRSTLRGRPVGWLAYNTARIEAGTPVFHVDFGHDSLPAETGVIEEAVNFNKGCYIGQEIVARMRDRGHPKRVLVGLKLSGEALPVAGAQVYEAGEDDEGESDPAFRSAQQRRLAGAAVIGGVTSSTLSPMLGRRAIAFAVMKWGRHELGTRVRVAADEGITEGEVHPLRFLDSA
ncbi:MAG: YgfZ/GcvT domain-containing protein, partial [Phycisphaeraceae bacterium]